MANSGTRNSRSLMASPSFDRLLRQLTVATKEKKARWSETADESSFRIGLGKGLVRISKDTGEDDRPIVRAVLINQDGRIADDKQTYLHTGDFDTDLFELF